VLDVAGRGSRIRTCGPLLPKQVLYQAELCPDTCNIKALVPMLFFPGTDWALPDVLVVAAQSTFAPAM
jgi:hypothetical protein